MTTDLVRQGTAWLAAALDVPTPFPWQTTLLERLLVGDCPSSLDLPTGLGKTSFIAIWLVARALGAPLPRRLVYVVDRRAVIDQATEVAEGLLPRLTEWRAERPSIDTALGLTAGATLPVSTLRGQLADNRRWLSDPSASAIVLGSVDMIGSRLLFEGYGVSRRMRPYHAGLLGADALVVLDEAHLVPAFHALVDGARASDRFGARSDLHAIVPALRLTSLSATGRSDAGTFRLTDADLSHPVVRRRLDAKKLIELRPAIEPESGALADALANEAWALCDDGREPMRCIVFTNARDDAQRVFKALSARGSPAKRGGVATAEVELFVGGRRVFERREAASWLRDRGFLAGHAAKPARPTFVVATSAGEVGVDLDADHMVSDVVPWERMVQRLGRVNRRGDGAARVIVVPTTPDKKTRAALEADEEDRDDEQRALVVRAARSAAVLDVIRRLPDEEGGRDGSPGALVALKQDAGRDEALRALVARATTPDPLRPELTRPLVESWSMTSLDAHAGRPEVDPWIRGWVDDEPQTSIVWRDVLPLRSDGGLLDARSTEAFFEAAPAHTLEILETETRRALDWLIARLDAIAERSGDAVAGPARAEGESADVGDSGPELRPALGEGDIVAFILREDAEPREVRAKLPEDERARKREVGDIERALTRGRLFVDARLGGLEGGLLEQERDGVAIDVSAGEHGVPFRVVATTLATPTDTSIREELRLVVDSSPEGIATRWLVVGRRPGESAVTEEGRSVSRAQLLDDHEACAERWAREIAARLALPSPYADVLALAARLHDEGKRAKRWQNAFRAKPDGVYGKTTSRPNIALLDGYRHEFGSLPYAQRDPRVAALPRELRDLCLHLIAAHHGNARPTVRTDGCEDAPPSALVERAQEIALRFARLERSWGPWGLAWWESLLRAADQRASQENDEQDPEVAHG